MQRNWRSSTGWVRGDRVSLLPICRGHKLMPTDAGTKIIDFVKRRFNIPERNAPRNGFE
ncbi:MAG: hypothetical protein EOO77_10225 [Oxalobacteraceae bacterium]|nr:MAG: hypothetical protein EOO77_10225 [Oxalobacteraceae bacterium]